jgi:hypothetical protein
VSDNTLFIIPVEPRYVPKKAAVATAVGVLRKLAPKADEIEELIDHTVTFRDCGESFDRVVCPACRKEIEIETWQEWMDGDYSETGGFSLRPNVLPCCKRSFTLAELRYEEPQGFSRFALVARNPNRDVPRAALAKLETALGCKLRIIWQRI